jgi:hypothetical protein
VATTSNSPVRKRITEILADETGGKSYKAHKYSLDNANRPNPDYGDVEKELEWSEYGETKHGKNYVDLTALSRGLPTGEGQLLTYFLDGSRHVFKVDDMGYDKGNRSVIYPMSTG